MPKILIVDDHPLSREGTAHALRDLPDRPQVLEAGTLAEAFELLVGGGTDLLLLDLDLGPTRGLDTLRQAQDWLDSRQLETRIVVLSGMPEPQLIQQALEHYATGFIPKAATRVVLQHAVTLTLAGGVYLPPMLKPGTERAAPGPAVDAAGLLSRLTPREREVAALLVKGLTNKRIAQKLQERDGRPLSDKTVRAHVGNIAWKLGVTENAKAGVMARIAQMGIHFDLPEKGPAE